MEAKQETIMVVSTAAQRTRLLQNNADWILFIFVHLEPLRNRLHTFKMARWVILLNYKPVSTSKIHVLVTPPQMSLYNIERSHLQHKKYCIQCDKQHTAQYYSVYNVNHPDAMTRLEYLPTLTYYEYSEW